MFGIQLDDDGTAPLSRYIDAINPQDVQRVRRHIEETTRNGTDYEIEYRVRNATGERWLLVRAKPDHPGSKTPQRARGVVLDITEKKRLEQERERLLIAERHARAQAEEASRLKDEFLATLSHELRTPLNAMLGWTQILQRKTSRPEDVAEGLRVIERNARTQARLIEDLLEMSRIISGKIRLELQPVPLLEVVSAAVDVVRPAAAVKGVRLETQLDDGIVHGDTSRLQQVFWNLLANAIKFTPQGGTVRVTLERKDAVIECDVADTGQGIAPEFLPHVFERFRQQDGSTTRRHGGLGLGLSIVKQLVELHGGTVNASSDGLNRGACFSVTLPLATVNNQAIRNADTLASAAEAVLLQGVQILAVEDDDDARDVLARTLRECGAQVTTASDAATAIQQLAGGHFDLLLSDIGMPGADGYELIRRVRAMPASQAGAIPAIAVSAFAGAEDRRRALLAGYQVHVSKPYDPVELCRTCAKLL
jgi:signal transduction histidine kinase/CheY-like chemotaxis protein